jgi:hypothetical protein
MPQYHSNVGNSTDGHVHYCAVITDQSPKVAPERLREQLCESEIC